jgi:hypothetical protein
MIIAMQYKLAIFGGNPANITDFARIAQAFEKIIKSLALNIAGG